MTWSREASRPPPAAGGGFTLLELLVVIAILGFALVLIAGYKAPWSNVAALRATAAELASGLRLARSEAILDNRSVVLALDLERHSWRVGAGSPHPLPARLSIELLTIAGERADARQGDIRFNPDGSSSGGRISIADGGGRIAIGVDWLTGRVHVANAH
ncbi:MAG TPA: GspH/FimT family pseudopilin [Stellaceae bacterium]|nr:GspH/FimT family pseudopilin [Stellaceae bacterium]